MLNMEEKRTERFYECAASGEDMWVNLIWKENPDRWEIEAVNADTYESIETDFSTDEPDEEQAVEEAKEYIRSLIIF